MKNAEKTKAELQIELIRLISLLDKEDKEKVIDFAQHLKEVERNQ